MVSILLLISFCWLVILLQLVEITEAIYSLPRESKTREMELLDGMWNFRISQADSASDVQENWYENELNKTEPVITIPVPSSYNNYDYWDHAGTVWYERKFNIPASWLPMFYKVWLRFSSVHYSATVWINGQEAFTHEGGYLPFGGEITHLIKFGDMNRVTVRVSNILSENTIPQKPTEKLPTDQDYNYAGIDRSVYLYTTPAIYVDDVKIDSTMIDETDNTARIRYEITLQGDNLHHNLVSCLVEVFDNEGELIQVEPEINDRGLSGTIELKNANLWWPRFMHEKPGYMYKLKIRVTQGRVNFDIYEQSFGIRSLELQENQWLINKKPIYIRGVDGRDDSELRGRGLDLAMATRDFYLLDWIGANSYRTSHRPLSEEVMDFADQAGVLIINECPAVDIHGPYTPELQRKHVETMKSLVTRDYNRPSVIMWSVGSTTSVNSEEASEYFKNLVNEVKSYDKNRPITAVIYGSSSNDMLGQYLDIIGITGYDIATINRFNKRDMSRLVEENLIGWQKKHNKPIFVAQYGVDAILGLHSSTSQILSEDYQVEIMSQHFNAFDKVRKETGNSFLGEISHLIDFKAAEGSYQDGDGKGIFTLDRQPKSSAHHLRKRYWLLAHEIEQVTPPSDLLNYVIHPLTHGITNFADPSNPGNRIAGILLTGKNENNNPDNEHGAK